MRTNYSYSDGRIRNDGVEFDRIRERSGRNIEKRDIITVDDPRELTRDRDFKNREKDLRTYIANREDLSREELKDFGIGSDLLVNGPRSGGVSCIAAIAVARAGNGDAV